MFVVILASLLLPLYGLSKKPWTYEFSLFGKDGAHFILLLCFHFKKT